MKIVRKLLITIPLVIIVVVVAIVLAVDRFGGRAVKFGIEKAGTKTLQVGVKVEDVDLSIMGGRLALYNLVVKNPEGYEHRELLELKSGSVKVDVRSLMSDTVKINQITLDGAEVVLEQKGLRNNIQDVVKAIPKGPEDEAAAEGKKLHIDELVISNTTVKVKLLPVPGRMDTIPLKLATIRMTNLGSDNKLNTAGLIGKILSAIARGIAEQGAGILPDDMIKGLSGGLGETLQAGMEIIKERTDVMKKVLEGAGDPGKKILEGAGDVGKGIGDGIKGLIPGKKKEE
jgi:hypothetical protein